MKVSREQMAENRLRILDAASRLFCEKGFDAVTVAEVMKAAGLTHGGFYGHFESKDDLVAQALTRAIETKASTKLDLKAYVASYLSPNHRDNPGGGCPTAGLAAETRHQSAAAQSAMTEGIRGQLRKLGASMPRGSDSERRRCAIASLSAMIGAVILSRAIDDRELSDEILDETHASIDASTT